MIAFLVGCACGLVVSWWAWQDGYTQGKYDHAKELLDEAKEALKRI